jgi:hypothetical protein
MFNGFSVVSALLIAVLIGVALTAYLWLVRRKQAETNAGIETLAAMRWREFSRLVLEALKPRGYVGESVEEGLDHGQEPDIRLSKQGQPWLLSCKQGANYRITAQTAHEFADNIRFHGAEGGILATPGKIDAQARKAAAGIEFFDGSEVWALVKPLLPATLLDDLSAGAQARTARETAMAWGAALILGFILASLLPADSGTELPGTQSPVTATHGLSTAVDPTNPPAVPPPAVAPADVAPPDVTRSEVPAPHPAAADDPDRDELDRNQVVHDVSALPGVDRALWSTKSTLLVYVQDDNADPVKSICVVLDQYENLRASRLHLQPPSGSPRPVRFLQCRVY